MKLYFDLHTHTLASGHAYSTLAENIAQAKAKGLAAYGFSEHAPEMPGSTHEIYFWNFKVVPKEVEGMKIFGGVEANIMDFDGTIDCTPNMYKGTAYVIASLHPPCIRPGTLEENTRALVGAMENPHVKIIGHPDDARYPVDYDVIAQAALRTGTILELNNSSIHPQSMRINGLENVKKLIAKCVEYGVPMIVGSDAHYCTEVGDFALMEALIAEMGVPEALIVNSSVEGLNRVLGEKIPG